jgi:carbamoyltransferase
MIDEDRWRQLFGFGVRRPEDELLPEHCDLALAIQMVTEEIVLNMVREAKRLTGSRYLCLAGGVALNCVANGRILKSGLFDDIWIQPAAGDAGGALGAAYCAHHIFFGAPRDADGKTDQMRGAFLGPEYSEAQARRIARKFTAPYRQHESFGDLCHEVARLLDGGSVVGWHQDRMEWGPRALGNRSILADARNPEMQRKLNLKIKFREGFRPFAPSVLVEDAGEYFDVETPSPYMLLIAAVREQRREALPEGYGAWSWREKLYRMRSDIPAVTHIDFSARLQTVHEETNPSYWRLLKAFKDRTGYSLISNTSFNVRGEPIVCTPEDAYRCFMRTEIDVLVLENCVLQKADQKPLVGNGDWRAEYELD